MVKMTPMGFVCFRKIRVNAGLHDCENSTSTVTLDSPFNFNTPDLFTINEMNHSQMKLTRRPTNKNICKETLGHATAGFV